MLSHTQFWLPIPELQRFAGWLRESPTNTAAVVLGLGEVERLAAVFALFWLVRRVQVNIFYASWVAHSLG